MQRTRIAMNFDITTLRIRPAQLSDHEGIARVWHQGWSDGHSGNVPDALVQYRRLENFQELVGARIGFTTVATTAGDDVIGFVTVIDDEVEQIYVAAEARGGGVATVLLEHAESVIAKAYDRAWLAVVSGNGRARRFYEKQGWVDSGSLDYHAETRDGRLLVPCRRHERSLLRTQPSVVGSAHSSSSR
jgi:GNAT superfamily N-acetyltransferase